MHEMPKSPIVINSTIVYENNGNCSVRAKITVSARWHPLPTTMSNSLDIPRDFHSVFQLREDKLQTCLAAKSINNTYVVENWH